MYTALYKRRRLLLFAAFALVAAGCGGGPEPEDPQPTDGTAPEETTQAQGGGEWVMQIGEPSALGPPQMVTESNGAQVLSGLFSELVIFDDNLKPQWGEESPDAAAATIEGNEDSTVWTITIKEGWTFHDGTPVTAQNYVDAWNWGAYAPNAADANYFFADIEGYDALNPSAPEDAPEDAAPPEPETDKLSGLKVIDDHTFEVTLAEPFRQYPMKLAYTAFNPMPPSAFEDLEAYNENPVGQGPFKMAQPWEHDVEIVLVPYEDYPGTQPKSDKVTFTLIDDLNTAYNELIGGGIDVMEVIPTERKTEAREQYPDQIFTADSSYFGFLGFPVYDEAFADPNIRKALSMALNRQEIVDVVLQNGEPATDYVSPVIPGYREGACGEACEFNPEKAKELWDEAGGVEGPLEIWFNTGGGHEAVYEAVANQWKQNLGISEVEFQILPFAEILSAFEQKSVTGPFRLAWVMDYPSMQNYIGNLLACTGSSNYTGYCNEEADALILQANAAGSLEEATELYQQADDLMLEDMPIIPFYYRNEEGIHSTNVTNVQFDERARVRLSEVEVVQD